mmetsp:Transcript_5048/g.4245  ORF Transcript_5048/g.4245 Transcript_5048/m.4245 type:complete len:95 (-) Transcript_5048:386-670(-)
MTYNSITPSPTPSSIFTFDQEDTTLPTPSLNTEEIQTPSCQSPSTQPPQFFQRSKKRHNTWSPDHDARLLKLYQVLKGDIKAIAKAMNETPILI